ncbi:YhgE/Pip family protein [Butyricicoccus sp.]|uniref:YhgE/Pip family protein n=1 Tax=Butyricicoccus sp. TaxID=2049021 RepID=UPI003D7DC378
MKNIWQIFKRDVLHIRQNVIAMIVIMGVTVVPCLYAWFNIAGSWDPYSNTGNLKVAVASVDDGYEGSLIPIRLNLGDQVLSSLRENTQMDWVFTSEENAVSGVQSGEYYAAIVIPKDFSSKMMSIFSEDIQKPKIVYYSNAKENAIAPKVTDKGASAIQKQINQTFIETVSDTALTALQSVSNMAKATGSESIADNLSKNLQQMAGDLSSASATMQSFSHLTSSAQQLLTATSDSLDQAKSQTSSGKKAVNDTKTTFSSLNGALNGATDSINSALSSGAGFYTQVSNTLDTAFDTQSKDASAVADTLNTLAGKIDNVTNAYTSLRDSIASIGTAHPELASLTEPIVAKLNSSITTQTDLRDKLNSTATSLKNSTTDLKTAKSELDALVNQSAQDVKQVQTDYESNLQDSLSSLSSSLSDVESNLGDLMSQIGDGVDGVSSLAKSANSDLTQIQSALNNSSSLLSDAAKKLTDASSKLDEMKQSGDYSELQTLLSDNKEALTSFLATPVSLKTHQIYKIDNYGSSMAPFYSTLSIWIGGIVLVAMLKVTVSKKCLEGLHRVKTHQIYLGRYIIFLIVGLMQSTLIAAGDLWYLGIQCEHPFLFLLACWFSSIVYVNIIYTLTVSFGDIGKAASVVLLVMQVAGSGGTFPIEVAPKFFQMVYPLLPFVHSMAAMRETVGGMYGMTYWIELGKLGIFLIVSLIVGLLLRKPIIRLNDAFTEKLEETKIM